MTIPLHCKLVCKFGYDDCFNCRFLKECFPKTFELRQLAIDKKWKDKYGDEF